MKALVLDEMFYRMSATHVTGGIEKAALCIAETLDAPLFTQRTSDGCDQIGAVKLHQSDVPPRIEWTDETSSREMNKRREGEIFSLVRKHGYDTVINNGFNATTINLSRSLREKLGVRTVHVCHSSFSTFSFPRFAAATAFWKHKQAGGVNMVVSADIIRQFSDMVDRKREFVGADVDASRVFDVVMPPVNLDYMPPLDIAPDSEREGVFAVSRFAPDKRPDLMVKILRILLRAGIKVEAHFMPFTGYENELEVAKADLEMMGATIRVNVPQKESFEVARKSVCTIMSSQIESFGIVPVEMACLGSPTLFSEHPKFRHALRDTISTHDGGVYGFCIGDKPQTPVILEAYAKCRAMDASYRADMARYFRARYSRQAMRGALEKAIGLSSYRLDPFA